MDRYANLLNCKTFSLPFVYLGLLIGGNSRRVDMWQPIVDKFSKMLSIWKQKNMSFGGRLCLINYVLTSLPLCYLFFFKMTKEVWRELVGVQKRFLWGRNEENKKLGWVSWNDICKSNKIGGLGVKNMNAFNIALLWKGR